MLNVHATNGPDNIDKIRRLFEEKNITDYTIYIHALKSSMASIGAETLSEMAKDMEQAGKEGNISYIEPSGGFFRATCRKSARPG